MAIDAFTSGALVVEGVVEWAGAIQSDALDAAEFPVVILDAAFPLDELGVLAGLVRFFGKEQGALEALSAKAKGAG